MELVMKRVIISSLFVLIATYIVLSLRTVPGYSVLSPLSNKYWKIQSIDTMKYSRDPSREKLNDSSFNLVIDKQMADIARTGANYVAIGTPYDDEFLPILHRWVNAARKYHLHIWFRGNFSGWEGWFDYPRIDRQTHIAMTKSFIAKNEDLFQDGDLFSSCPECENGSTIQTGNPVWVADYRAFLIEEYQTTKDGFFAINKKVASNYFSMNGDVARAVMDKPTTASLDGMVVVDHYVASPKDLADNLRSIAEQSGGQVMLGEFGAPIPDIHGNMTDDEQKQWIAEALKQLSQVPQVIGVNYWVNVGGSTALWDDSGKAKPAVGAISAYYSSHKIF